MPWIRSIVALLVVTAVAWADHEVRTLSNQSKRGTVVEIAKNEVHVKDSTGDIEKVPLSQVLAINLRSSRTEPPKVAHTLIQLYDDSRLYCKSVTFKGGNKVHVELLGGQTIELPLESLTSMLRDAHKKELRQQFETQLEKVTKNDRVMIFKNGQLNPILGALGDVDAAGEKIQFQVAATGGLIKASLNKLQGMIWYRIKAPYKAPICLVIDTMGNRVGAKDVAVKDDAFIVTLPAGGKISFKEITVAKLDYNRGKLTFLSDLKPSDVVERSNIGLILRYRQDANLDGQDIFLGGTKHFKGLSMHAHTELEYKLNGKFKEMKFVLAADPRIGNTESKAIVIIRGDGAEIFRGQVTSKPENQTVNIRNVRKLRIIVRSSNVLDLHDHATLADVRVVQ